MIKFEAPYPLNEPERLRLLRLYNILDTGAERSFDDLTRLAAAICEVPIALISLVDEERQWFKARVGLTQTHTPRDVSFCAHAIVQDELFVVEDALADERFRQSPLVTEDPHVRFYAGAPLTVGGASLGTLCVLDRKPRRLSSHQLEALQVLRSAVVSQLELRRALHDLEGIHQVLPMCSWCRSTQCADGTWEPLHEYVMHTVPVTHGVCPECEGKQRADW